MRKKPKRSEEELEQAFQSAQASLAMEGLILTEEEKELVMKKRRGEITHREFTRQAYNLATGKEWEG